MEQYVVVLLAAPFASAVCVYTDKKNLVKLDKATFVKMHIQRILLIYSYT